MGANEYFASLGGLLWVFGILFAIMLGVHGLVFYWQSTTPELLKKIPQSFHRVQTECRKIIAETRPYTTDDPLPYGPLVAGVQRQLDNIANQLVPLKSQYVDIQDRVHALKLRSWKMLIGAPFYLMIWYSIRKETLQILHEHAELNKVVDAVWQDIAEIKKQAWLVAMKAREIFAREQDVRQLLDNLGNRKLCGDTFEIAATQEESVIEALEKIPEYFLLAEEEKISKLSTKGVICEVYGLLNQVEPVLDELRDRLTLWTNEYKRLTEKARQVQQQLDQVERVLANILEGIDSTDESNRLRSVHTTVDVLTATLSRLEVESFALVDQELDRALDTISDIGRRVRKALRQYTSLTNLIENLTTVQIDCSEIFSQLFKSHPYPIQWDRSNHEFLELNKATNDLSPVQKSRTLDQVDQDMTTIDVLSLRWVTLQVTLKQVEAQHEELLRLLTMVEIEQGSNWLDEYKLLNEQIAVYHPDNWPKSDAVSHYTEAISRVDVKHQVVLARDPAQSILESELSVWIEQVEKLIEEHKNLRLRSEKIRARLEWLQEEEEKAREQYQAARSMINQLSWIVNSNSFLREIAETEVKRINQNLDRRGEELEKSSEGIIEKKSRTIRLNFEEIGLAAKRWLEQLNREIDRRIIILVEKIDRLYQIAILEDPVLEKVRRMLALEERRAVNSVSDPFMVFSEEEMVMELKGRSVAWQELVAVQQELEEIVENPLSDSFRHASEQRRKTLIALDRATQKIPDHREWPPSSVMIAQQKNEFEQLEGRWRALKNEHLRAIWAVRQYGELAASYQVLAGRVDSSYQRAVEEQDRVLELEKEIEQLLRIWQQKGHRYASNPVVMEQLRDLRARANLVLEHQKQKWVSSSTAGAESLTYQGLVQNLEEITRFLKTTRIAVNQAEGESIDLFLEEA